MRLILLGKIVKTHGIKGEIRIISNFDRKDLVFHEGFNIYIGNLYQKEIINTYRVHKNYDMISIKNINNINDVLKYIGKNVYINYDDLNLNTNQYIFDDLIGLNIKENNENLGIVNDIYDNNGNTLLAINYLKNYYIPYKSDYIKKIDIKNKEIITENVKELIL